VFVNRYSKSIYEGGKTDSFYYYTRGVVIRQGVTVVCGQTSEHIHLVNNSFTICSIHRRYSRCLMKENQMDRTYKTHKKRFKFSAENKGEGNMEELSVDQNVILKSVLIRLSRLVSVLGCIL
jgi:hypothetical protein